MSAFAKENIPMFRQCLHELVDLICDYFETIDERPAKASVLPGELRASLGSAAPLVPIAWADAKEQLTSVIFEGANHWQHPRNHGYFPCMTSFPAIMGEMISKTLNNPGFSWHVSPINTELEILMNDWVADALGLPEFYKHTSRIGGGLTHSSASESVLVALIGARNKFPGETQVVYASELAHFSSRKAAKILKLEFRAVPTKLCPTTGNFVMNPDSLKEIVEEDRRAGKTPTMVVATFGATATCAIDPVRALGELTQREHIWLHIDAAYAGSALICPEFRPLIDGVELSDSFNFNGHKWLMTGFNNSTLYVKEPQYLMQSFSATASYIIPPKPEETDFMSWQISQGRDFRGIRWWMLLTQYGITGLQSHIRKHISLAKAFEDLLLNDEAFDVPFQAQFGLVCFSLRDDDAKTRRLADSIQERKDSIWTSAEYRGRKILRFCVASEYTEERHIQQAYATLKEELALLS
jgi:aromatic-L-amino-acid decarboxylase